MIRSLWIAKTGMEGQQTKLDAVSNNLANVGTNGYKRAGVVFEDLMYQNLRQAARPPASRASCPPACRWAWACAPRPPRATSRRARCSRPATTWTWPSRARASSRSRCPTAAPATRATAPSRWTPTGSSSPRRLHGAARHHHPGRRAGGDDRRRRHRQRHAAGAGRAAAGGPAAAGQLHQPGRAGAARAEPVRRDRASGTPTPARRAATGWARCSRASSRAATSTWSRSW
jgi:hypothetical protein